MKERIQKYLATEGYGSRREIERWLTERKIRSPEGVYQLGDRVSKNSLIYFKGKRIQVSFTSIDTRVIAYHKKEGEVSTRKDTRKRPTVMDSLPKIKRGRWISVGRLDLNTSGIILFSNDGQLVHGLMHPSRQIEREYLCRVRGKVTDRHLNLLQEGVYSNKEKLRFNRVSLMRKTGVNQWCRIVLTRGKNREIRRAWESIGFQVSRLIRIRYGPIRLSRNLKKGNWLELNQQQIGLLKDLSEFKSGSD